jgi:hypothetical protein
MKRTLMAMTAALALAVALPTLAGAQAPWGPAEAVEVVGVAVPRRAAVVVAAGAEVEVVEAEAASRAGAVAAHRRQGRAPRPLVRSAWAGERPAAGHHPAAISRHAAAIGKAAATGSLPAGIIAARSSLASAHRTSTITQRRIPTTTGTTAAGPIASCAERIAACGFATDPWHERRATAAGRAP